MTQSDLEIWIVIIGLGIGSMVIRLSFLGIIGDRPLPNWALRLLRYTPVAVMPGLAAPLIFAPHVTGGALDLPRILAAAATLGLGLWTRNVVISVLAGMGTLYTMMALLG